MTNARSAPTPFLKGYYPPADNEPVDIELKSKFQQVIGSLLYLTLGTCPDIAYAVTALSQHAARPSHEHLNCALYICQYLLRTRHYSLVFDGGSQAGLIAFTDSDWASDPITHRSQTGWFLKLANGIFSWQSCHQERVAHSSTEAEYVALSDCSKQVIWIRSLLSELGYELKPIPICGDNQESIFMASNPVTEKRSKHVDIHWHAIRDFHEKKIELFFIEGAVNPADVLMKNVGHIKLDQFRKDIGLIFHDQAQE
jgi:hypothetical protein